VQRFLRVIAILVAASMLGPRSVEAQLGQPELPRQTSQDLKRAAQRFDQGQKHYNAGRYNEAVKAFSEAQRLAPHHSALFNIARCHENLGDRIKAMDFYRQALDLATDPSKKADIEFRIRRLQSRPVKVFVSSQPSGARVSVGGKAAPEASPTPTVIQLAPGEHVLLLRMEGHHLEARRIEVQMDKDLPVEVKLRPVAPPCPPPLPPCQQPAPCPTAPTLVDVDGLHLHVSLLGAFGLTTQRPVAAGPAVQATATYRRFIFGGHFMAFPMGEEQVGDPPLPSGVTNTKASFRWLIGQLEGGYRFPFRNWYAYATLGLGVSADRVTFIGTDGQGEEQRAVKEAVAFAWSLGGGAEAMITSWLSLGVALRIGVIHGDRVDKGNKGQIDDQHHFPYGSLWGSMTFHL